MANIQIKSKKSFLDHLGRNILIFDGGMGTSIYSKGVYINRCFDELNLSEPEMIEEIHREYILAGAEAVETNTFGANGIKLEKFGLGDKVYEINYRGAQIARQAARGECFVVGSIGPLGIKIEPWGEMSVDEAKEIFAQQAKGLLDGGVDCFILETFGDLNEIHQAIRGVREVCSLPVIASMTITEDCTSLYGTPPEVFAKRLEEWGADVIGVNCSVGPASMLEAIERMSRITERWLSAQPNAGMPRNVSDRNIYLCSPEYMGKYAKYFLQRGVRIVGGCCGTTPEMVRAIRNAVRAYSPSHSRVQVELVAQAEVVEQCEVTPVPQAEKSRFGAKIARGEFVTSVELNPPRGCDPGRILRKAELLKEGGVDAINIPDGPRATARMSPMAISVLIEQRVGIETILHYCCRDRNLLGMQSDLLGATALGLKNILIITGDPPKLGDYPQATAVFDVDSIGLTNLVYRLNHGMDLGGNKIGKPTRYLIGVGVNPGAHDLDLEIHRFEWKVDAGAEFAITQPVFDVGLLERFLSRIEHVRIPIIAGIWPLASYRNAEFLHNEVPGVRIPEEIIRRMERAELEKRSKVEGIKIAQEALLRVRDMVEGVQVSAPFGRVKSALEVLSVLD